MESKNGKIAQADLNLLLTSPLVDGVRITTQAGSEDKSKICMAKDGQWNFWEVEIIAHKP